MTSANWTHSCSKLDTDILGSVEREASMTTDQPAGSPTIEKRAAPIMGSQDDRKPTPIIGGWRVVRIGIVSPPPDGESAHHASLPFPGRSSPNFHELVLPIAIGRCSSTSIGEMLFESRNVVGVSHHATSFHFGGGRSILTRSTTCGRYFSEHAILVNVVKNDDVNFVAQVLCLQHASNSPEARRSPFSSHSFVDHIDLATGVAFP